MIEYLCLVVALGAVGIPTAVYVCRRLAIQRARNVMRGGARLDVRQAVERGRGRR